MKRSFTSKLNCLIALFILQFCLPIIAAPQNLANSLTIYKYPGNYACFKFIYNGITVITDPYKMNERINPTIVTISHNDADHNELTQLFGKYKLMNKVESYAIKDVSIKGIAGHHNKGDVGITNIIYLFDFNGIHLAHFASLGEVPTEQMYEQLGTVDILLIQCYSNDKKLSADEVIEIAKKMRAKIIIPEHGTPGCIETKFNYFLGPVVQYKSGKFTITKDQLDKIYTPVLRILDTP